MGAKGIIDLIQSIFDTRTILLLYLLLSGNDSVRILIICISQTSIGLNNFGPIWINFRPEMVRYLKVNIREHFYPDI